MRGVLLILFGISFLIYVKCHSHSHSHSEPPHFKYSKEANKPHTEEDDALDPEEHSHETAHGHSHGKTPGHAHSHGDHGHSHGGHGHSHEKAPEHSHEGHGHSHEKAPEHSHEGRGHSHEKASEHSHEGHGHSHEKAPEHTHEGHGHSHEKAPEHSHEGHGHSHEKASEHSHKGHGHSHESQYGSQKPDGHGHSHDGGHGHSHDTNQAQTPPTTASKSDSLIDSMWLRAIAATGLISAAPVIILWFIPLDNSQKHNAFLKVLLSFASGGLLGDAFLHLIPHAIDPHDPSPNDHSHSHSHNAKGHSHDHTKNMQVGLWVVAGIMCFLCVEKFVRYVKGGHAHSHSVAAPESKSSDKSDKKKKEVKPSKTEDIKVAGYLNLAADFAHNFTDGLAIGASFLVSDSIGIVTTITILFHEIPHEIGDFAILIQSGCSKRRAMLLQLTTAVGAMLGTLCSLLAQGAGQAATAWILPFTAGGFIYIATVSVIPELLEDSKAFQSVKEIFAMIVGVAMMIVIAFYE